MDILAMVAETITELRPKVLWKTEFENDEIEHVAEEITISVESVAWFLLTAYSKMQEERKKLRKKVLNTEETRT